MTKRKQVDEKTVSAGQAATMMSVSLQTVHNMVEDGRLHDVAERKPALERHRIRLLREEVEKYMPPKGEGAGQ